MNPGNTNNNTNNTNNNADSLRTKYILGFVLFFVITIILYIWNPYDLFTKYTSASIFISLFLGMFFIIMIVFYDYLFKRNKVEWKQSDSKTEEIDFITDYKVYSNEFGRIFKLSDYSFIDLNN